MTSRRIEYIDTFRAFGIILMIMGHIGFGGKFDFFIHAFHMPMFFFVSGMFFNPDENDYFNVVRKKAATLLIPYAFFGTLHYLIWLGGKWHLINYTSPLCHLMFLNTEGLPVAGALWFLTALFFTQCIYYALSCLIRNNITRNIIIIMLTLLGLRAKRFIPFELYWALGASLSGLGLYHCGYMLRKYSSSNFIAQKLFNLNIIETLTAGAIITVLIFKSRA